MRRAPRVLIPAEPKPDCGCCGKAWTYDFSCRACLGRYVRNLQRQHRQSWYAEAAAECGREAVEAFIADSVRA